MQRNEKVRGNILKKSKDVSLKEQQDDGTKSFIDISISPDALVDKTTGNQILASGISSVGQPGAQIRRCSLILERVISVVRVVQAQSLKPESKGA